MDDLFVLIKGYQNQRRVDDTVDSVLGCMRGRVGCAVICPSDATIQERVVPLIRTSSPWRLGSGLFGLMLEGIRWAYTTQDFYHLLILDDDTLIIKMDGDIDLLSKITSDRIGLLGVVIRNHDFWKMKFYRDRSRIARHFGMCYTKYQPGDLVAGPLYLLTNRLLSSMDSHGFLAPGFESIAHGCVVSDESLMAYSCAAVGLEYKDISDILSIHWWKYPGDPRDLPEHIVAFHPTKLDYANHSPLEWGIREEFKKRREVMRNEIAIDQS